MERESEARPWTYAVVWLGSVPTAEHVGPLVEKFTLPWRLSWLGGSVMADAGATGNARADATAPHEASATR